MTNIRRGICGAIIALGAVVACVRDVPYTERAPSVHIPRALVDGAGHVAYRRLLDGQRLAQGEDADVVREVGARLEPRYTFDLVRGAGAGRLWCLPGRRVAVADELLPSLQSEAGLALVVAHVLGHCRGEHLAERLSQRTRPLGSALDDFASGIPITEEAQQRILAALGAWPRGTSPIAFGRAHEVEADVMALMQAAGAGYPPDIAVDLWARLDTERLLPGHPWSAERERALRDWMPRALKRFRRNGAPGRAAAAARWGRTESL